MKTLLLLAGQSTRFWPLQDKALFQLCGKTLLEHQVERLHAAKLNDITLIGGAHNLGAAHALFPDMPIIEQEDLERGMQGALLSALPTCGTEPVLIVSSNDLIHSSGFADLLSTQKKMRGGAILAQRVQRYFPGGYLILDGNRVTGIQEKPGEGNEPSDLVTIVAHIHPDASVLLQELHHTSGDASDAYERAMGALFSKSEYVAVPYEGVWQPVKYPWHLLSVLQTILDEIHKPFIHKKATIHPTAVVEGNVVLEEGVRVLPHATIRGPCYIGKGTVVANNALVRESSIGENCVIGFCTEAVRSITADSVWTHMSYIGDSIIGSNVSFGGGTMTGNLRLDEEEILSEIKGMKISSGMTKFGAVVGDNVRIGIQVGLNPGVKIGKNSFIAGGTFVSRDIPDGSFALLKDGVFTIRENRSPPLSADGRVRFRDKL